MVLRATQSLSQVHDTDPLARPRLKGAVFKSAQFFSRLWHGWRYAVAYRKGLAELQRLDDRLLKDIGIEPHELSSWVRKAGSMPGYGRDGWR